MKMDGQKMNIISLVLAIFFIFSCIGPALADTSMIASPASIDATKQSPGTTADISSEFKEHWDCSFKYEFRHCQNHAEKQ